jgi:hypothetical protein
MLMSEDPCIIHESGAVYSERGRTLRAVKKGLDLSDPGACLKFDIEEEIGYFGWWYLVIPVSHVTGSGYPLPLFIKWDDIEYGIRKRDVTKITLNGISAWHDSFADKFSVSNSYSYYFARNCLVVGCTAGVLKRRDVIRMLRNALFETVCYRYGCAEMMLRGVNDFLKGPEFVFGRCLDGMIGSIPVGIGRTEELRKEGEFEDPDNVRRRCLGIRMLTMNGLLLPSRKDIETRPGNMESSDFYRVRKVLYNIDGEDGFIAGRSAARTFSVLLRTVRPAIRTLLSFGRLRRRYENSFGKYTSDEQWRTIFGSEPGGRP